MAIGLYLKSLDLTVVPVRFRPQAPLDNKDLARFGLGLFYCLILAGQCRVNARLLSEDKL